ncbi:helix-turn-helix transcriptional regulator [Paenibacillus sp. FSL P2-0322]|uniref:helix-turn-helix domain-containing protein n=1 Tax=Paenibacillus sp. FSL P2-0322 TaxID=2921628 RepID=UPI002D8DC351|nr:helix-turn-helix transcriptional regulator [Paenibacillus jamilae]
MELHERVKKVMEQQGVSQYKLAVEAEIPHSSMSSFLQGKTKNPSIEMVSKIAGVLNVTTDYLLGKTEVNLYDWIPSPKEEAAKKAVIIQEDSPSYKLEKEPAKSVKDVILPIEELVKLKLSYKGHELTHEEKVKLGKLIRAAADLLE